MKNLNPHQLAEKRMELSEQYSKYAGELARLIKREAEYYNQNREKHKSDTALKRAFQVTEEGTQITIIKLKLSALKIEMSSIKTMLETLTEEARGLY